MSKGTTRAIVSIVIGALVGGFVGLFLGIFIFCSLYPESNLCGLGGVFVGLPAGVVIGGIAGALWAHLRRDPDEPGSVLDVLRLFAALALAAVGCWAALHCLGGCYRAIAQWTGLMVPQPGERFVLYILFFGGIAAICFSTALLVRPKSKDSPSPREADF